jgi:hypothetical protein
METKSTDAASSGPQAFLKLGREQTEATLGIQKELLEAYEHASRAWIDRIKKEVELWSELANKLSTTRSFPDALGAYQESVAHRIKMATDDGAQLSAECQEMMGKITRSLSRNWPTASS